MVERKESQGFEEFDGLVVSVEAKNSTFNENLQYELAIEPIGFKVGGKTGKFHEWIPLSKTSSDEQIAKGSVMDAFLRQVEICVPAAKKAKTVTEAMNMLKGKKFHFQKMELGRAYGGKEARQYSVPVKAI